MKHQIQVDYLPTELAMPLIAILWTVALLVLFWKPLGEMFSAHFATRRHNRRERNRRNLAR